MTVPLTHLSELESLGRRVGGDRSVVAVVKAADEHVLDCVVHATQEGLIRPVLIDSAQAVATVLAGRLHESEYDVVDVADDNEAAAEGVRLVREGKASVLMKGHLSSGAFLKPVVNKETGIRTSPLLSHVMLVENPQVGRVVAVTDGGMLTVPAAEQYPALIGHAVQVMQALGEASPKVALLSAAENVIPRLPSAELQAAYTAEHADDDVVVEGPISVDLALIPAAAAEKGWQGRIQGDASIIVAPDIVAGNALAKSLALFGNGGTAGVVLGASAPIVLVSRAATAEEKYNSLALARLVQGVEK